MALPLRPDRIPKGREFSEPREHCDGRKARQRRREGLLHLRVCSEAAKACDALETGERFEIQVAGERVYVPARAEFNVEHEREEDEEELEFQLKWTNR